MGFKSELKQTSKGAEIMKAIRKRSNQMSRTIVVEEIISACFAEETVAKKAALIREYLPLIERWDTKPYRRISGMIFYLKGFESGFHRDPIPVVRIGDGEFAF